MKTTLHGFRLRALATLLVSSGFALLLLSGIVLFLSPPGRIANWTNWTMLGLTKHGWSDLHIAFGALFLVAGAIHLAFNWRPFLQHLGARLGAHRGLRLEWVVALIAVAGLAAATRAKIPPVSHLLAWGESLRARWDDDRQRAPIPHAEWLTLAELASQAGVPLPEAQRRLESAGVKTDSTDIKVQALADRSRITPARIYELLRADPAASSSSGKQGNHSGRGPGGGGGGGPGWKTLEQFCSDEGLDPATARARLTEKGIRHSAGQTLREIAVDNGFDRPYALLEILRQK